MISGPKYLNTQAITWNDDTKDKEEIIAIDYDGH
jgi:hypothetical protein